MYARTNMDVNGDAHVAEILCVNWMNKVWMNRDGFAAKPDDLFDVSWNHGGSEGLEAKTHHEDKELFVSAFVIIFCKAEASLKSSV